MKDHRDFADFYEASLQFFYEAATAIRLTAGIQKFRYITMAFLALVVLGLWNQLPRVLLLSLATGGLFWLATSSLLRSRKYSATLLQVQQQALNDLVALYQPQWRYTVRSPRMRKEIRESGLFPQRLDFIHEQGCIAGMVGLCLMAAVKVELGNYFFVNQNTGSVPRRRRSRRLVYSGFLIAMEYPKSFKGILLVRREVGATPATLELLPFEKVFKVHTAQNELVDLLLTPTMKQKLLFLDQQFAQFPLSLSFKDSVLYVAVPWEQDLFSAADALQSQWQTAYDDARLVQMLGTITQELLTEQQLPDPASRVL